MKLRFLAIVLMLLAPLLHAAEITAGWKMPVESFVPGFPRSTGLRKLEKPPGESAFFQPGDELWDVSKVGEWPFQSKPGEASEEDPFGGGPSGVTRKPWQGGWVVWNARSGMFVARGSLGDILAAQAGLGFDEQPFVIRSTFELEGAGKPQRSFSLVSRSGEKAVVDSDDMDLGLEAIAAQDGETASLRLNASWKGDKEGTRWKFEGAVTTEDDMRYLLASQGSGDSAWKLFVTTRYERMGGIPRSEARWIESSGKLRRWPEAGHDQDLVRKPLGGGLHAATMTGVSAEVFLLGEPAPELPVVTVPDALKAEAEGPVLDLKEWMKAHGIDVSRPGFFAGIDVTASRLLIIGDDAAVDFCGEYFPEAYCGATGTLWISSNEAAGNWGASTLSGEKVRLARQAASGEEDLLFELEPTLGTSKTIMDLHLKADMVSRDKSLGRIESMATLQMGKPMEFARRTTPDGKTVALEVTATFVPFKY